MGIKLLSSILICKKPKQYGLQIELQISREVKSVKSIRKMLQKIILKLLNTREYLNFIILLKFPKPLSLRSVLFLAKLCQLFLSLKMTECGMCGGWSAES